MLIVGAIAFFAAELLYGSRGPDSGAIQFVLYGLVGFIPATISSWLAYKAVSRSCTHCLPPDCAATVSCCRRRNLRRLRALPI